MSQVSMLQHLKPPPCAVTAAVNRYSHFFSVSREIDSGAVHGAPQGDPDALSLHDTSHMHPPPAPRPRDATRRPPEDGYTMIHTRPIRRDPAPKNTAHERYRRRPPWPQACARVASAATAMAWGCMRPLWMPFAAGAHDWRHLQGRQRAGGRAGEAGIM